MNLKLDFPIPKSALKINISDSIYLIGSCFSNEIGAQLLHNKFQLLSNPFGIIFNPHSIFKLLGEDLLRENLVENEGVHYHWDTHGEISALDPKQTIEMLESRKKKAHSFLKKAKWLIITLGSAWVYRYKKSGNIVANRHKIPPQEFDRELMSSTEIVREFEILHDHLQRRHPKIHIVFTVSPVRHLAEGLIENNRSKSMLLSAVHEIVDSKKNVSYFPSYEMLIDELRDHRFYAEDLVHPSRQAAQYLMDRFSETYFDDETLSFVSQWKKIKASIEHQPFHVHSEKHQEFLKNTLKKLEELNKKVNFHKEIKTLQSHMK